MASITINPVATQTNQTSNVSGVEKIIAINSEGKASMITINLIIDKMDDTVVDRIDDELLERLEDLIDDIVDERLENIDTSGTLKWVEVL